MNEGATKPLTLEDLARAVKENHLAISDGYYTHAARAILTTIKEAGYRIVPVEATEEMCDAARKAPFPAVLFDSRRAQENISLQVNWQAMLAASPVIEGE